MLSTKPSASPKTHSQSMSSNPTMHPDSMRLLEARVPESLHSVLGSYVFCDPDKAQQSRRFRFLLKLETSGDLIPFLEQQPYAPEHIYDLYAESPKARPPRQSLTKRMPRFHNRDEVYTSVEPLPPDAHHRIRGAMASQGITMPHRTSPTVKVRPDDFLAISVPDCLEAPALADWLRRQAE